MSKFKNKNRVWGYVDDEGLAFLLECQKRENRSEAEVISILLQRAIKERSRKRATKESNT